MSSSLDIFSGSCCVICLRNTENGDPCKITILILPCRHQNVCNECINLVQKCPVCRGDIEDTISNKDCKEFVAPGGKTVQELMEIRHRMAKAENTRIMSQMIRLKGNYSLTEFTIIEMERAKATTRGSNIVYSTPNATINAHEDALMYTVEYKQGRKTIHEIHPFLGKKDVRESVTASSGSYTLDTVRLSRLSRCIFLLTRSTT